MTRGKLARRYNSRVVNGLAGVDVAVTAHSSGGSIEGIARAKSKEGERKYIELLNERGQEDTGSTGKKKGV
jgi:hypothetical protein